MAKRIIAIDLDGTLHEFRDGWDGEVLTGKPIKDAKWAVETIIKAGYEVVVFTTRENKSEVYKWLLWKGFPKMEITNRKPRALAYVDDRGVRFENNWQSIVKLFC